MDKLVTKKITSSPHLSGVYIFLNKNKAIYVGKANDLNSRLKSYLDMRSRKNRFIAKEANNLKTIITNNDIEALILEAKLIKEKQPKYNTVLKDGKNYFFVKISNHVMPRISITHDQFPVSGKTIGPFTSGASLKELLKLLRWSFPFCTCESSHTKECLNSQMGLCFGFCCDKKEPTKDQIKLYAENIKSIEKILNLNNAGLISSLKKQIKDAILKSDFEKANVLKKQILGIENIFRHKSSTTQTKVQNYKEVKTFLEKQFGTKKEISKIEMYDVSNISGQHAVASLVFFDQGVNDKKNYKKFKIKYTELLPNDIKMLKEVFTRRSKNVHWQMPDLMLIDGGIAQLNAAIAVFSNNTAFKNVLFGSLAKGKKQLLTWKSSKVEYLNIEEMPKEVQNFLKLVQDEAHRFAIEYHHKLYLKNIK